MHLSQSTVSFKVTKHLRIYYLLVELDKKIPRTSKNVLVYQIELEPGELLK